MRVADYMTAEVMTLKPDTVLEEALNFFRSKHVRHLPVLDDGRLVGIVTDRDVKRATPSLLDKSVTRERYLAVLAETPLRRIMAEQPLCVAADTDMREAVALMRDQRISGLPVVDGTHLIGILTHSDVLRAFAELLERTKD